MNLLHQLMWFKRDLVHMYEFYFKDLNYPYFGDEDCEYCFIPVTSCGQFDSHEDIINKALKNFLDLSPNDEEYKTIYSIAENSFKYERKVKLYSGDDTIFGKQYWKRVDCYYMSFC